MTSNCCPLEDIRARIRLMKAGISACQKSRKPQLKEENPGNSIDTGLGANCNTDTHIYTGKRGSPDVLSCDERSYRAYIERRFSCISVVSIASQSPSPSSKRVSFASPLVQVFVVSQHEGEDKARVFYTKEELTAMASTERIRRNLLQLTLLVWRRHASLTQHKVAVMYHRLLKKCQGVQSSSSRDDSPPKPLDRPPCKKRCLFAARADDRKTSFYAREA